MEDIRLFGDLFPADVSPKRRQLVVRSQTVYGDYVFLTNDLKVHVSLMFVHWTYIQFIHPFVRVSAALLPAPFVWGGIVPVALSLPQISDCFNVHFHCPPAKERYNN